MSQPPLSPGFTPPEKPASAAPDASGTALAEKIAAENRSASFGKTDDAAKAPSPSAAGTEDTASEAQQDQKDSDKDSLHPDAAHDSPVSVQSRHAHELNFYLGMRETTAWAASGALLAALCVGALLNSQGILNWTRDLPLSATSRALVDAATVWDGWMQDAGLTEVHSGLRKQMDRLAVLPPLSVDLLDALPGPGDDGELPSDAEPGPAVIATPPVDAVIPPDLDRVESLRPDQRTDQRPPEQIDPDRPRNDF